MTSSIDRVELDGPDLVLVVRQYADRCRVEVRSFDDRQVMVQTRPTRELAIAAIARDLTTYAARALASLPTIGDME